MFANMLNDFRAHALTRDRLFDRLAVHLHRLDRLGEVTGMALDVDRVGD